MEEGEINLIKDYAMHDNSILAIFLFGSQVKGKTNKYSDIDIGILFDEKIKKENYTDTQISIITNLTDRLNKEVDVIILNKASLFLKYYILKDGVKIYERAGREEHNFEAISILQYFDFLPIKNRIENGLLRKIKEA